jgi:hypothetical protein
MTGPIKQIGIHRVRHGNVMDGIDDLMRGDGASIIYTDPPWGGGNLKYWATMNRKMTGATVEAPPLDLFLDKIFSIARRYGDAYLLVEYGLRWREIIDTFGASAGYESHGVVPLLYQGGGKALPLDLHLFAKRGWSYPDGYHAAVANSTGYETLRRAIPPLADIVRARGAPTILLDPCCGMGYSAQAAVDTGLAFRGNELNEVRLAKTIARLQ